MLFVRSEAKYILILSLFVFLLPLHIFAQEDVYGIIYQEGKRNYVLNNYIEAIENFRKIYLLNKEDGVNKIFLYKALVKQGDVEYKNKNLLEAEKYYSEAFNLYDKPNQELVNKINTIIEIKTFLSREEKKHSENLILVIIMFLLPVIIIGVLISITFYYSRKSHKNINDVKKHFRIDFDPNIKLLDYVRPKEEESSPFDEKRYKNSVKSELFRFISRLIDAKTGRKNHSSGVAELSYRMAKKIKDPALFPERVKMVALIHDIGYLSMENSVIKDSEISEESFRINGDDIIETEFHSENEIKSHPEKGMELLEYMNLPDIYLDGIMYHHEHFDGTGFPDGLSGTQIPMIARIISTADHYLYEYVTNGKDKEKSVRKIETLSGSVLDPAMVDVLISIVT